MKKGLNQISERLKEARGRMTQVAAAKALGISQAVLSKMESGIREPTASELERFAKLYNRSVAYFFEAKNEHVLSALKQPFSKRVSISEKFETLDYKYAEGRVVESVGFILREMKEFDTDYASAKWEEYGRDVKLQKLIERTVENILTALIEVAGTVLARKGIGAENYAEIMAKAGELFRISQRDCKTLAALAFQRNRLVHRYLDLKWQVILTFKRERPLIRKFLKKVLDGEGIKT